LPPSWRPYGIKQNRTQHMDYSYFTSDSWPSQLSVLPPSLEGNRTVQADEPNRHLSAVGVAAPNFLREDFDIDHDQNESPAGAFQQSSPTAFFPPSQRFMPYFPANSSPEDSAVSKQEYSPTLSRSRETITYKQYPAVQRKSGKEDNILTPLESRRRAQNRRAYVEAMKGTYPR